MASPRLLVSTALLSMTTLAAPAAASASGLSDAVNTVTSLLPPALTATDDACSNEVESQPFARWADASHYVAVPGGGFEADRSDWTSSGRVSIVRDNEPWKVSGNDADERAVSLAPGAAVSSPSVCGGIDHPTVRLFAKSAGALPATALVAIRYTGPGDHLLAVAPLGVITTTSQWKPTNVALTLSGVKLVTGAHIGITVTALTGTVLVDDVFVDPYRRS